MTDRHLFILDEATINAVDYEVVRATVADLRALNLYHLPYKQVSIRIPQRIIVSPIDSDAARRKHNRIPWKLVNGKYFPDLPDAHYLEVRDITESGIGEMWLCHDGSDPRWHTYAGRLDDYPLFQEEIRDILVTLLATKNVLKSTHIDKLARLGIARKNPRHRYSYVTTISVPTEGLEDDPDHPAPAGAPRRPHLRRGHIRNQHYGPHNSFLKRIWIEPIFVNADPAFVSKRKAYNISFQRSQLCPSING